ERYARWLKELSDEPPGFRDYDSFEALAERLRGNNKRLTAERSLFLAHHWGSKKPDGRVALASDPLHKLVNPVLYRVDEAAACWKNVSAPVLWVSGAETEIPKRLKLSDADIAARKARFRGLPERLLQGAGHMLHHDQPERVAEVIEEFLR